MKRLTIIASLFISMTTLAQTEDALLWTGIGLDLDLSKKVNIKYETQLRFDNNATTLKTYYNEISADYEPIKNLTLGGSYRYSRIGKNNYYEGSNRFCINTSYSQKIDNLDLRLKARARYQFKFDRLTQINNAIYPEYANTFRLKLDLKYKNSSFKTIQPRIFYELFETLDASRNIKGQLSAYRIGAGINFDLPNRQDIALRYIYEKEQGFIPSVSHIYLIQYNYTFKSKLFKKKNN